MFCGCMCTYMHESMKSVCILTSYPYIPPPPHVLYMMRKLKKIFKKIILIFFIFFRYEDIFGMGVGTTLSVLVVVGILLLLGFRFRLLRLYNIMRFCVPPPERPHRPNRGDPEQGLEMGPVNGDGGNDDGGDGEGRRGDGARPFQDNGRPVTPQQSHQPHMTPQQPQSLTPQQPQSVTSQQPRMPLTPQYPRMPLTPRRPAPQPPGLQFSTPSAGAADDGAGTSSHIGAAAGAQQDGTRPRQDGPPAREPINLRSRDQYGAGDNAQTRF